MMKKTTLILFFIFLAIGLNAQKQFYIYDYYIKSPVENKVYHQLAHLYIDKNSNLYEVLPIDNLEEGFKENTDGSFVSIKKDDFKYLQYTKNETIKISDKLQGKIYHLKDQIAEMNWQHHNETKFVDGVMLSKASVSFRGRNYVAWYDAKTKSSSGPWKFRNLNYLLVEVYSEDGKAQWKLKSKPILQKGIVEDPFVNVPLSEFRDYKDYTDLAYGISPKLKQALSKNPNNKFFEQPRNQLETKLE